MPLSDPWSIAGDSVGERQSVWRGSSELAVPFGQGDVGYILGVVAAMIIVAEILRWIDARIRLIISRFLQGEKSGVTCISVMRKPVQKVTTRRLQLWIWLDLVF